jgi:hypothetical protein
MVDVWVAGLLPVDLRANGAVRTVGFCDFHVQGSIAQEIAPKIKLIGKILIVSMEMVATHSDEGAAPIFGVKIPLPGYRDWRLISVAHEKGNLNDLRVILGNDVAIRAYREGKRCAEEECVT